MPGRIINECDLVAPCKQYEAQYEVWGRYYSASKYPLSFQTIDKVLLLADFKVCLFTFAGEIELVSCS